VRILQRKIIGEKLNENDRLSPHLVLQKRVQYRSQAIVEVTLRKNLFNYNEIDDEFVDGNSKKF